MVLEEIDENILNKQPTNDSVKDLKPFTLESILCYYILICTAVSQDYQYCIFFINIFSYKYYKRCSTTAWLETRRLSKVQRLLFQTHR